MLCLVTQHETIISAVPECWTGAKVRVGWRGMAETLWLKRAVEPLSRVSGLAGTPMGVVLHMKRKLRPLFS